MSYLRETLDYRASRDDLPDEDRGRGRGARRAGACWCEVQLEQGAWVGREIGLTSVQEPERDLIERGLAGHAEHATEVLVGEGRGDRGRVGTRTGRAPSDLRGGQAKLNGHVVVPFGHRGVDHRHAIDVELEA